jgi:hypothetical protein
VKLADKIFCPSNNSQFVQTLSGAAPPAVWVQTSTSDSVTLMIAKPACKRRESGFVYGYNIFYSQCIDDCDVDKGNIIRELFSIPHRAGKRV